MMKKTVAAVLVVLTLISLTSCGIHISSDWKNDIKTFIISHLPKFSSEEIDAADKCVKEKLKDFEGCSLKTISYSMKKSKEKLKYFAEKDDGYLDGVADENALVLITTVKTDGRSRSDGLEPNTEYDNWMWLLTRESESSDWTIVCWEY